MGGHAADRQSPTSPLPGPRPPSNLDPPRPRFQVQIAGEKDLADIATLMEEVDLRIGELKKSTFDFKRDVVVAEAGGGGDVGKGPGTTSGSSVDADLVVK